MKTLFIVEHFSENNWHEVRGRLEDGKLVASYTTHLYVDMLIGKKSGSSLYCEVSSSITTSFGGYNVPKKANYQFENSENSKCSLQMTLKTVYLFVEIFHGVANLDCYCGVIRAKLSFLNVRF